MAFITCNYSRIVVNAPFQPTPELLGKIIEMFEIDIVFILAPMHACSDLHTYCHGCIDDLPELTTFPRHPNPQNQDLFAETTHDHTASKVANSQAVYVAMTTRFRACMTW